MEGEGSRGEMEMEMGGLWMSRIINQTNVRIEG